MKNSMAPQEHRIAAGACRAAGFKGLCGAGRDKTTYPLANRSLRVVCGRNSEEAASDSNGSGKTTLVMSSLWALTGRSDARAEVRQQLLPLP